MKKQDKLAISGSKIYLFKSVSEDGTKNQGVYFTTNPHWRTGEVAECMRLLANDTYEAGLYTYKVKKSGKIKLKQVRRAVNLDPKTGDFITSDLREDEGDKGDPGYETPSPTLDELAKSMVSRLADINEMVDAHDTIVSRNLDDDENDDDADLYSQPVLQFIISTSNEVNNLQKISIITLVNRITDRSISADIKEACITAYLKSQELTIPTTYEVAVRCYAGVNPSKRGVKLTFTRLQDDHRFTNYHGLAVIGAVEKNPCFDKTLDYLQHKLSDCIIAKINLGDSDDQIDLNRAIYNLT